MCASRASRAAITALSPTSVSSRRRPPPHLLEDVHEVGRRKKRHDEVDDRYDGEQRRDKTRDENLWRVDAAEFPGVLDIHVAHRRHLEIFAAEQVCIGDNEADGANAEENRR